MASHLPPDSTSGSTEEFNSSAASSEDLPVASEDLSSESSETTQILLPVESNGLSAEISPDKSHQESTEISSGPSETTEPSDSLNTTEPSDTTESSDITESSETIAEPSNTLIDTEITENIESNETISESSDITESSDTIAESSDITESSDTIAESSDTIAESSDITESSETIAEPSDTLIDTEITENIESNEAISESNETVTESSETIAESSNITKSSDTIAESSDITESSETIAESSETIAEPSNTLIDTEITENIESNETISESSDITEPSDTITESSDTIAESSDTIAESSDITESSETIAEPSNTLIDTEITENIESNETISESSDITESSDTIAESSDITESSDTIAESSDITESSETIAEPSNTLIDTEITENIESNETISESSDITEPSDTIAESSDITESSDTIAESSDTIAESSDITESSETIAEPSNTLINTEISEPIDQSSQQLPWSSFNLPDSKNIFYSKAPKFTITKYPSLPKKINSPLKFDSAFGKAMTKFFQWEDSSPEILISMDNNSLLQLYSNALDSYIAYDIKATALELVRRGYFLAVETLGIIYQYGYKGIRPNQDAFYFVVYYAFEFGLLWGINQFVAHFPSSFFPSKKKRNDFLNILFKKYIIPGATQMSNPKSMSLISDNFSLPCMNQLGIKRNQVLYLALCKSIIALSIICDLENVDPVDPLFDKSFGYFPSPPGYESVIQKCPNDAHSILEFYPKTKLCDREMDIEMSNRKSPFFHRKYFKESVGCIYKILLYCKETLYAAESKMFPLIVNSAKKLGPPLLSKASLYSIGIEELLHGSDQYFLKQLGASLYLCNSFWLILDSLLFRLTHFPFHLPLPVSSSLISSAIKYPETRPSYLDNSDEWDQELERHSAIPLSTLITLSPKDPDFNPAAIIFYCEKNKKFSLPIQKSQLCAFSEKSSTNDPKNQIKRIASLAKFSLFTYPELVFIESAGQEFEDCMKMISETSLMMIENPNIAVEQCLSSMDSLFYLEIVRQSKNRGIQPPTLKEAHDFCLSRSKVIFEFLLSYFPNVYVNGSVLVSKARFYQLLISGMQTLHSNEILVHPDPTFALKYFLSEDRVDDFVSFSICITLISSIFDHSGLNLNFLYDFFQSIGPKLARELLDHSHISPQPLLSLSLTLDVPESTIDSYYFNEPIPESIDFEWIKANIKDVCKHLISRINKLMRSKVTFEPLNTWCLYSSLEASFKLGLSGNTVPEIEEELSVVSVLTDASPTQAAIGNWGKLKQFAVEYVSKATKYLNSSQETTNTGMEAESSSSNDQLPPFYRFTENFLVSFFEKSFLIGEPNNLVVYLMTLYYSFPEKYPIDDGVLYEIVEFILKNGTLINPENAFNMFQLFFSIDHHGYKMARDTWALSNPGKQIPSDIEYQFIIPFQSHEHFTPLRKEFANDRLTKLLLPLGVIYNDILRFFIYTMSPSENTFFIHYPVFFQNLMISRQATAILLLRSGLLKYKTLHKLDPFQAEHPDDPYSKETFRVLPSIAETMVLKIQKASKLKKNPQKLSTSTFANEINPTLSLASPLTYFKQLGYFMSTPTTEYPFQHIPELRGISQFFLKHLFYIIKSFSIPRFSFVETLLIRYDLFNRICFVEVLRRILEKSKEPFPEKIFQDLVNLVPLGLHPVHLLIPDEVITPEIIDILKNYDSNGIRITTPFLTRFNEMKRLTRTLAYEEVPNSQIPPNNEAYLVSFLYKKCFYSHFTALIQTGLIKMPGINFSVLLNMAYCSDNKYPELAPILDTLQKEFMDIDSQSFYAKLYPERIKPVSLPTASESDTVSQSNPKSPQQPLTTSNNLSQKDPLIQLVHEMAFPFRAKSPSQFTEKDQLNSFTRYFIIFSGFTPGFAPRKTRLLLDFLTFFNKTHFNLQIALAYRHCGYKQAFLSEIIFGANILLQTQQYLRQMPTNATPVTRQMEDILIHDICVAFPYITLDPLMFSLWNKHQVPPELYKYDSHFMSMFRSIHYRHGTVVRLNLIIQYLKVLVLNRQLTPEFARYFHSAFSQMSNISIEHLIGFLAGQDFNPPPLKAFIPKQWIRDDILSTVTEPASLPSDPSMKEKSSWFSAKSVAMASLGAIFAFGGVYYTLNRFKKKKTDDS